MHKRTDHPKSTVMRLSQNVRDILTKLTAQATLAKHSRVTMSSIVEKAIQDYARKEGVK